MDGLKPALGRPTRLKPPLGTTSLTRRPGWLHPGVAAGATVPSSDFQSRERVAGLEEMDGLKPALGRSGP